jgi:hypothetical protein
MTAEDRAYTGSRYRDVRDALYANPYRGGASGEQPGPLPLFQSTIANAWCGAMGRRPDHFRDASARSVDSRADLRWGPDGKGFRRIISPNGICLLGVWEIAEDTPYTGYFARGAKGLIIGRYSSDGVEVRRGQRRSLSLAGKLYPTMDPDHAEPLIPASFMAQEDLGGMHTDYINDADLRNEPNVTAHRRGKYVLILMRAGFHFIMQDRVPDVRQLYEIAELGHSSGVPTRTPRHMLLRMAPGQRRVDGDGLDFRDEIYMHLFEPGDTAPTGSLVFDISVSDADQRRGPPGYIRVPVSNWRRIGRIRFTEAVASYNADHVIHFHHPGWRDDRDDPSTAVRAGETRVRK